MKSIIVVGIFALSISMSVSSDKIDVKQFNDYAQKTVSTIQSGNFDALSKMFHYPPSYTKLALEKDRCHVKNDMTDLFDYFGIPEKLKEERKNSSQYITGGGSGDLSYWSKHPKSITTTKQVVFGKKGVGVLVIEMVLINNLIELKTIRVGFYSDDANAKSKMLNAYEFLNKKRNERRANGDCERLQGDQE
jgi:hypothetical protein